MDKKTHEKIYNEIVKIYDYGHEVVRATENMEEKYQRSTSFLISPIINQVSESTDNLAEAYLRPLKANRKPNHKEVQVTESAIRRLFTTILDYTDKASKTDAIAGKSVEARFPSNSILDSFIQNKGDLWTGPHAKNLKNLMKTHSHLSSITSAVLELGWVVERIGRAFQNPEIGLVKNLIMVEPGIREQERLLATQKVF